MIFLLFINIFINILKNILKNIFIYLLCSYTKLTLSFLFPVEAKNVGPKGSTSGYSQLANIILSLKD